jgi:hypothetical protein
MATKVNKEQEVTLQDGKKVTVRPLNIKLLREFMSVVQKFGEIESDVDGLDLMVEATQVALTKAAPDIAEDRDYLEDNLDLDSIHTIMWVAGGVDMSGEGDRNPNPQEKTG